MDGLCAGAIVGGAIELTAVVAIHEGRSLWRARHHGWNAEVEVTVLAASLGQQDSRRVLQFHATAKHFENLRSAHAQRTFSHGLTGERQPYLVHERLAGMSLAARLTSGQRLSLREVSRMVLQLTAVYGEAHRRGLVTGSVSPYDIWLVPADDLLAKLAPTGAVREAIDDWDQHCLRAPERRARASVDGRADLWALGAAAHFALTGQPPRDVRKSGVVVRQAPASEVRPWSAAIDEWFRIALAPAPEQRFQSAEEMAGSWCEAFDAVDDGICFADEVVTAEALTG